jgi:hypothetical protein
LAVCSTPLAVSAQVVALVAYSVQSGLNTLAACRSEFAGAAAVAYMLAALVPVVYTLPGALAAREVQVAAQIAGPRQW